MKKALKIVRRPLYRIRNARRYEGPNPGMTDVRSDLYGDCTGLDGVCIGLFGDCSGITGDATLVTGDCTHVCGNLDDCEIVKAVYIMELIS